MAIPEGDVDAASSGSQASRQPGRLGGGGMSAVAGSRGLDGGFGL